MECHELVRPYRSTQWCTPSIWMHSSSCMCNPDSSDDAHYAADENLSSRVEAASGSRARLEADLSVQLKSAYAQRTSGIVSMIRFFAPAPVPSTEDIALLCLGCSTLDIGLVTRCLSNRNIPINSQNHIGTTPLMAAISAPKAAVLPKSHLAMIKFLLNSGADPNASTKPAGRLGIQPNTALTTACSLNLPSVVRLLLERGANANAPLPGIGTKAGKQRPRRASIRMAPIHVAVFADRPDCLDVLLQAGSADVNASFTAASPIYTGPSETTGAVEGVRALHLAYRSSACVSILLRHGADAAARDGRGKTPLDWAVGGEGSGDASALLVAAGVDGAAVDIDGESAPGSLAACRVRPPELAAPPSHRQFSRVLAGRGDMMRTPKSRYYGWI